MARGGQQGRSGWGRAVYRQSSSAVQSVVDFEIEIVNGIGLGAFGAV
jgi:hypothetical protein